MEPVTLHSPQGTTATVTTLSTLRELQEAGWTLTPQVPAESLHVAPVADAAPVTVVTPVKRPGRPKKGVN